MPVARTFPGVHRNSKQQREAAADKPRSPNSVIRLSQRLSFVLPACHAGSLQSPGGQCMKFQREAGLDMLQNRRAVLPRGVPEVDSCWLRLYILIWEI